MELSEREPFIRKRVLDEMSQLSRSGSDLIAIACNTTQYFSDSIETELSDTPSRFIALAPIIKSWVTKQSPKSIFIAGIDFVTEDSDWSAFRFLHEMDNVVLPDQNLSKAIVELAYAVKVEGANGVTYQKFRSILRRANADICLLLLTELSQIFERYPRNVLNGKEIIDALDLYSQKIVDSATSDLTK